MSQGGNELIRSSGDGLDSVSSRPCKLPGQTNKKNSFEDLILP